MKINYKLCFYLFFLIIISLLSIYSAENLIISNSFFIKQIIWYILSIILILIVLKIDTNYLFDYSLYLYIIFNVLLLFLLFFGTPINDSKCWFTIPFIGSFQPSEFMKIVLIIYLASLINKYKEQYINPTVKEEFLFLLKILFIVFIPSFLTFLEPDTGVVIIYLIIALTMLFIANIRLRWFILVFSIFTFLISFILCLYFYNQNLFIKLLGTSFFLRIDRLLDWSNMIGFQLEKSLVSIGSSGFFGHGFSNTPLYFPEAETDFIFAVFSSNFGFIGSFILISIILFFDLKLINISLKCNNLYKYTIIGTLGMLIYQQFQNIGMTIGILPITGITLPFISYGGSSLLSYMFMIGIILKISNKKKIN